MSTFTEVLPERKSNRRSAVRWLPCPDEFGPVAGFLSIQTGRDACGYKVEEFPVSWPGRGFRLAKVGTGTGTDAAADGYDVFCSSRGPGADSCDCRGFTRAGHCKHADAVRALIGNDWL